MAETDVNSATKDSSNNGNSNVPNGGSGNSKDSSGGGVTKKLSAMAPAFDVSGSPTLDPYAGPHGVRTQPCYVPPAQIPPPAPQPPPQQQQTAATTQGRDANAAAQNGAQTQSSSKDRSYYPPDYDYNSDMRDPRRPPPQQPAQQQQQMYNYPPKQQQMPPPQAPPQHMRGGPPPPQQQQPFPPPWAQKYPPNYPGGGMNRMPPPHPNQPPYDPHYGRHPGHGGGPPPPMNPRPHPNQQQYGVPGPGPDGYGQIGYMPPGPSRGGPYGGGPPPPHANGSSSQQPSVNGQHSNLQSPQQNGASNGAAGDKHSSAGAGGGGAQPPPPPQQQQQQSPNVLPPRAEQPQAAPPQQPGKVQFKTATNQKNARAVGPTMAYKHPSRSHFGQPKPELRDPKFTNPSNLLHLQRWELLESAKRWLPGEGTLITWGNYRYLIGPPIHMGMNGHIHYCYKYPLPPHKREQKKAAAEKEKERKKKEKEQAKAGDGADNAGDGKKDQQEKDKAAAEEAAAAAEDQEEIEEIDINSPCVETLAAKIVPNTPAFAREIVILRALQHCENVTELYEVLESERTLISILELAQADVYNFFVGRGSTRHGWNLEKPAVREHFSKMVISNVVQGLDQMHKAQYLHCDLKSLNILLYIYVTDHSNRRGGVYIKAKLTDFGHSSHGTTRIAEKLFSNGMARVGTAGHVAPELFKEGTKCTEKIDIWSLGIVMFSMLVPGRLLFSEYTNLELLKQKYDRLNKMNPWSRDRPSWWTDFERLSPEARDLILWMTRYDPSQRPTCADILKHPWFLIGKASHREHYRPKLKYVDMLCSSSIAQE